MNLKPLVIDKLKDFSKEFPEYNIGQLLYSMLSNYNVKEDFKKSNLLEISDTEFYSMIEKAMKKEHQPEEK